MSVCDECVFRGGICLACRAVTVCNVCVDVQHVQLYLHCCVWLN